jgi:hypothetical protein
MLAVGELTVRMQAKGGDTRASVAWRGRHPPDGERLLILVHGFANSENSARVVRDPDLPAPHSVAGEEKGRFG